MSLLSGATEESLFLPLLQRCFPVVSSSHGNTDSPPQRCWLCLKAGSECLSLLVAMGGTGILAGRSEGTTLLENDFLLSF